MGVIDKLYDQYSTGKKIKSASEDPIIASRALKFRTNIANTQQYLRNTAQGLSWMEITEYAFVNIDNTLREIRTEAEKAANGTYELSDRQAIVTKIQTLFESLQSEMNVDYAGRYVFSGYRTDEPPTFLENNDFRFLITQQFMPGDIEKVKAYIKPAVGTPPSNVGIEPEVFEVYRFKLPYNYVTGLDESFISFNDTLNLPVSIPVRQVAVTDVNSYDMSAYTTPMIHYIPETGEMVFDEATAKLLMSASGGFNVTYIKEGFSQGELNPRVYFDCIEYGAVTTGFEPIGITQAQLDRLILPAGGIFHIGGPTNGFQLVQGTHYTITTDPDIVPSGMDAAIILDPSITQEIIDLYAVGGHICILEGGMVIRCLNILPQITSPPAKAYSMANQQLKYEFGANTTIQINNLAKDVFTATLFADLKNLCEFINSIQLSTEDEIVTRLKEFYGNSLSKEELDDMVAKQQTAEIQKYREVMYNRFNNMLRLIDNHSAQVSKEYTTLGSRMNRLELINERLEQDRISYTQLMSDNENVDYMEVIMRLNSAEAIYSASLQVGANIMMLTLVDFIR
jgi:flagellar hook-associated protein 3 FlgL